ncbi:MAG: ChuX/HutX family heme-like substrate-binding protein [Verrucomicrobiota bacterium]
MSDTGIISNSSDLKESWDKLLQEKPKLRIRDAAKELGVSEAELLATKCGESVTRLTGDWKDLIKSFVELGNVMALTRNDHAVHEKIGKFEHIEFFGPHMGQVVGKQIDLRLFMSHWHMSFAVEEEVRGETKQSFQFFNQDGSAIFKVYLHEGGNWAGFETLKERFKSDDQSAEQDTTPLPEEKEELPDSQIDLEGFHKGWEGLQDTHGFYGLLQKYRVSRTQALRLAPSQYVTRVGNDSARKVLDAAGATETPIMVFVGNPGNIQIHTGPVKKLMPYEDWYNVMDPDFNLHLRESGIDQSYIVKKPTKDGLVTALELYDKENDNIALFFGERKPGIPELEAWRDIIGNIEQSK